MNRSFPNLLAASSASASPSPSAFSISSNANANLNPASAQAQPQALTQLTSSRRTGSGAQLALSATSTASSSANASASASASASSSDTLASRPTVTGGAVFELAPAANSRVYSLTECASPRCTVLQVPYFVLFNNQRLCNSSRIAQNRYVCVYASLIYSIRVGSVN